MTDNQAAQMVESLEKIEKHLQAIDWKFWDLYQRFSKEDEEASNREKPVKEVNVDDELESLAEIVNDLTTAPAVTAPEVKHTLKYPSIEILK